jgi:predicted amidophosphoribosyltransferase
LQAATAFNILVEFVHIALAVVAWLMIRQITQWQEARHASGERYDGQQPACPACGEKVSLMLGNCQMCGADLTPTAASQDFN